MVAPIKFPLVIGIAANRYQAGKSTVLGRFRKHGEVYKLAYADALKGICLDLGWDGEKDEKGRRLLQLMGTEVCRECLDYNYWVKKWVAKFSAFIRKYVTDFVICDDLRFENEHENIKKFNGTTIYVYRPEKLIHRIKKILFFWRKSHSSEGRIKPSDCDYIIRNDGTLEEFTAEIDRIIKEILGQQVNNG